MEHKVYKIEHELDQSFVSVWDVEHYLMQSSTSTSTVITHDGKL